jgi:geranylgeranyl pyrophosphate synthase
MLNPLRDKYLADIEQQMLQVIAEVNPADSSLTEMGHYQLATGGKRLRALLPLVVADALGHDPAPLIPFGAACEMLHNATLVHDDVQDGDEHRRGQPTVWKKFGTERAINLGDAMFYYAVLLVQRLDHEPTVKLAVANRLITETLRVIDGQEREFLLQHVDSPTVDGYFKMVQGKTSGLFALPMAGAAMLCGQGQKVIKMLAQSAQHLGVLFQLQDDVLDLYGDKGRGVHGNDIREGKRSLMAIHALTHASPSQSTWLREVLDTPREQTSSRDTDAACTLLKEVGALDFALVNIDARRSLALSTLEPHGVIRERIDSLCEILLSPIQQIAQGRA